MRKSAFCFAVAITFAAAAAAQTGLPTTDQVLEKYIQATGGKTAWVKLNSRYKKGVVDVPTFNASGVFEEYTKAPGKRFIKSTFEGYGDVIQACDGASAWAEQPENGRRDLSGAELAAEKRSSDFYGALHMKDQYPRMSVTGKAKVGARDAYVIEAEPAEGSPEKFYFDGENGLLLRIDRKAGDGIATVAFEDYRDADGVKIPHTTKVDLPQVSLVYKTTELKHQVAIDDAKFARPAK